MTFCLFLWCKVKANSMRREPHAAFFFSLTFKVMDDMEWRKTYNLEFFSRKVPGYR